MHQLISADDDFVSCLVCGAVLRVDDFGEVFDGRGNPANGSWACSGDTDQQHGDPVEHGHEPDDPRYARECDCFLCRV